MAVIRDMIPAFELFQPTSAEDAIDRLIEYGDEGWVLAGGMDSFDWWKERVKTPTAVVDLAHVLDLACVIALACVRRFDHVNFFRDLSLSIIYFMKISQLICPS